MANPLGSGPLACRRRMGPVSRLTTSQLRRAYGAGFGTCRPGDLRALPRPAGHVPLRTHRDARHWRTHRAQKDPGYVRTITGALCIATRSRKRVATTMSVLIQKEDTLNLPSPYDRLRQ